MIFFFIMTFVAYKMVMEERVPVFTFQFKFWISSIIFINWGKLNGIFCGCGETEVFTVDIYKCDWFWTPCTKEIEKTLMWAKLIIGNEQAAFCSDILMRVFSNNSFLERLHFHPTENPTQGRKMLFLKALCDLFENR